MCTGTIPNTLWERNWVIFRAVLNAEVKRKIPMSLPGIDPGSSNLQAFTLLKHHGRKLFIK
jgi:hypothetical protein